MSTLTAAPEITSDDLAWAESYLRAKVGEPAVEFAGVGLVEARDTFDSSRGVPFRGWASRVLIWIAKRELRRTAPISGYELFDHDGSPNESEEVSMPDQRRQLVSALRRIDEMAAPARWIVLARYLADFDNAAIGQILGRHRSRIAQLRRDIAQHTPEELTESSDRRGPMEPGPLCFCDLHELIDAVMLFGGQLFPTSPGGSLVRIGISRSQAKLPELAWMILVLEQNGIGMTLAGKEGSVGRRLPYRSEASNLMLMAYRRWYDGDGKHAITPTMEITHGKLAAWLVRSLGKSGKQIRLKAPSLESEVAHNLSFQICELTDWATYADGSGIVICETREIVEAWLRDIVPEQVWSHTGHLTRT